LVFFDDDGTGVFGTPGKVVGALPSLNATLSIRLESK
jgi:hypothetical protein